MLTEACDPTADFVLEHLNERGVGFWRVDPGDFPDTLDLSATFDRSWSGQVRGPLRAVDLAGVRAVYYRRPSGFRTPPGLTDQERQFVESQARHAIFGLLAGLPDVLWVNRPGAMADARVKPYQLAVAAVAGLTTPSTLITNRPDEVVAFGRQHRRIITKSLAMVTLKDAEDRTGLLYTAEVPEEDWANPGIAATAHLFQEVVPRDFEVRMTYVAGECFATAMRPDDSSGALDIRAHSRRVSHQAIRVPAAIAEPVHEMMGRLGLVFGAFDFIVRPDGQWIFIELNPNGQWAWTEQAAGLPISTALADLLEKGAVA